MTIFAKDPAATIDYAIDWAALYLGGEPPTGPDPGVSITASAWAVSPADAGAISVEGAAILAGRTVATLAGGVAGRVYHVTNSVTFSDSRNDERTLVVRVEAR